MTNGFVWFTCTPSFKFFKFVYNFVRINITFFRTSLLRFHLVCLNEAYPEIIQNTLQFIFPLLNLEKEILISTQNNF